MKSTKKTQERSQRTEINFKAVFTGCTYTTPVMFNPTADDLRRIKNINPEWDINEPEYTRVIKEEDYRIISLMCKFNPNKTLKLKKSEYANDVFVDYKIYISDRTVVGAKSGKTQIIDQHNQNGWILLEGDAPLAEQVRKAQLEDSPYKNGDPIRRMNPDTARPAKQGEVALYDLVFRMSTLDRHYINEDAPEKSTRLDEFKLGENPEEVWSNLVNGDYTSLNMLMADNEQDFEGKNFFVTDGVNNRLGLMLGARPNSDKDKLWQSVLSPFTVNPVGFEATYRSTDREWDYSDTIYEGVKLTKSKLSKKAVEYMTHEDYPWKDFWNHSLEFQEVTVEDLPENNSSADQDVSTDDNGDDLPF